jgi:hypothetical protein
MLQLEETCKLLAAYLSGLQEPGVRSQNSIEKNREVRIQYPFLILDSDSWLLDSF